MTEPPNPLQPIGVHDIINALGYTNDIEAVRMAAPEAPLTPISKAPEAGETLGCTCETEGRCAPCDRLPWVVQQRLLASDLQRQTSRTANSSPSTYQSATDTAEVREIENTNG